MATKNRNTKPRKPHGHAKNSLVSGEREFTKTYRSWRCMMRRCFAKSGLGYKNYVAKGITVCNRWLEFTNFLADMGDAPEGFTLDRIDSTVGYMPGNCRWATMTENVRNRSNTRKVEFRGEIRPLAEWAELMGLKYKTLQRRINLGWDIERAMTLPKMSHKESSALGKKSRWG